MKKLFGLLTFILIGLINFGYCDTVGTLLNNNNISSTYIDTDHWKTLINFGFDEDFTVCFRLYGVVNSTVNIGISQIDNYDPSAYVNYYRGRVGQYYCIYKSINDGYLVAKSAYSNDTIYGDYFILNDLLDTTIPVLTSLECQQEYNLIPISSVDQNYCVNNGLCPSGGGDCPVCPGSGDNWSALYINNIQHLGKPIINVTIPDYITWDYTTNENEFNLYCGSGYDEDYINSVIAINSYRPDSGDFTNIFVSGLTLVFPYIVIVLFIVFVRRLLKRIFR